MTPDDFQDIQSYVEDGGGYVYLASAAVPTDLEANYQWIGARSLGFSGVGDIVTVSMDNPLGTSLLEGDVLKQQAPEQSGAVWVDDLEPGAGTLANYSGGEAFAYSYQYGLGKIYFQSDADHGIADDVAKQDIKYLLEAGILWATSDIDLGSQDDADDFLPDGTIENLGREPPSGSLEVVFSGQGQDMRQFPDPADPARSIFVNVNSEVVGATLFFESAGIEYRYHVQPDSGALLTFSSEINVTDVTVTVEDQLDVDGSIQPAATVGYETVRSPPACILPVGATSSASAIPSDATEVGSPGSTVGSTLDLPGVPIPINSFFVGLDKSDVTGFTINFESGGVDYSCPITPSMVEISFDEPLAISDINIENVGPWGVVGHSEPPEDVTVYVKHSISKAILLPPGIQVHANSTAPEEVHTIVLGGQMGIFLLPGPSNGQVASMWISTGGEMTEPYLYFRSGDEWYSTTVDQGTGTLFTFSDDTEINELYISFDAAQDAEITVGYTYPISVKARAGSDLTVEELQLVYLDGSASTGRPGGLSFAWSQVEGPDVDLRGSSTQSASFAAPRVDESGDRLAFKLVVRDSKGHESQDLVVVRVTDDSQSANEPPIIREIVSLTVNEGDKVVITASAFDPEGSQLSYLWTQTLGATVLLAGQNTPALSFDAPPVSEDVALSFRVEAIDENGNGSSEMATVLVRNLPEVVVGPPPSVSAGTDQSVNEGANVMLKGTYGDSSGSHTFRWEQVAGTMVTLSDPASLNASFVAPAVDDGTEEVLRFRLSVIDGEIVELSDEVSITVKSAVSSGVPVDVVQPTETNFGVGEPPFSIVRRVDVVPPEDVYEVIFQGSEGQVTQPTSQIYGIWANTTGDVTGLKLYFSSSGHQYYIETAGNQVFAYVFDRPVTLQDIRMSAIEADQQTIHVGYYYGPVPLAFPALFQPENSPFRTSNDVPVNIIQSPANPDPLIAGFISRNLMLAGIMAVGVPSGIAVALKVASTRRNRQHGDTRKAAKLLFPKSDPVAGEAEKVRPVIEELERMLGRDLDTAVSASELLDRFGSGSRNGSSDR
ncbi:MAG TPA: hypothetical protein VIE86_02255 [Nitrososphaera sp.]